jgi:hypothetical protein
MIFHEIHSAYYRTVRKLIVALLQGKATDAELQQIVRENAFEESVLTILPSLYRGKWPLLRPDRTTILRHAPTRPLTETEKRWLKALYMDPRMRLFGEMPDELSDVVPLFTPSDYCIYDQYGDGDPYKDEAYQTRFRVIHGAVRNRQPLRLEVLCRRGGTEAFVLHPARLEYSEKDDKFRLIGTVKHRRRIVNLARVADCAVCGPAQNPAASVQNVRRTVTLKLRNERNTPERVLLHFAHLEKQAVREESHWLVHLHYDAADETEMLIRILSFGPMVEVIAPERFRNLIIKRLKAQKSCGPI